MMSCLLSASYIAVGEGEGRAMIEDVLLQLARLAHSTTYLGEARAAAMAIAKGASREQIDRALVPLRAALSTAYAECAHPEYPENNFLLIAASAVRTDMLATDALAHRCGCVTRTDGASCWIDWMSRCSQEQAT